MSSRGSRKFDSCWWREDAVRFLFTPYKKESRQIQTRDGGGQAGPYLHEQDLVRTIRDTGEREWGAHRDTEGGWAGFDPHDRAGSQEFPSRIPIGQSCTRRHGGRRGPPTGCVVLLLLTTRDSDRLAASRWTPYSTGDLSRLATFLRLLTGSLSLSFWEFGSPWSTCLESSCGEFLLCSSARLADCLV